MSCFSGILLQKQENYVGAGELTQWLRALPALLEDLSSAPSIHVSGTQTLQSQPALGNQAPSLVSEGTYTGVHLPTNTHHTTPHYTHTTHTHARYTHTHACPPT